MPTAVDFETLQPVTADQLPDIIEEPPTARFGTNFLKDATEFWTNRTSVARCAGDFATASHACYMSMLFETEAFALTPPDWKKTRGILAISAVSAAFVTPHLAWRAGLRKAARAYRADARAVLAAILALDGDRALPDWAVANVRDIETDVRRELANNRRRWKREHPNDPPDDFPRLFKPR